MEGGPDILAMFLKLEPVTLPKSEFIPTSLNKFQDVPLYSIKEYLHVLPFDSKMQYISGSDKDYTKEDAWNTKLLQNILTMEKVSIIPINGFSNLMLRANFYHPIVSSDISLGHFKVSVGKDESGPYLSVFDVWDFGPSFNGVWDWSGSNRGFEKFQPILLDLLGEPLGFYDRFYPNENKIRQEVTRRQNK